MTLILVLLPLPALYALWNVYAAFRAQRALVPLPREVATREKWPRLSVIVPACNEAGSIEAATKAKLASDYPNLEIVLVDDRSTDETSEIVDRLAAGDPRVRVLHIRELPSGWLGKVHALHRGTAEATGEWLLYSDADVHMAPTLLRRVIAAAEARHLDFVGVMPTIWSSGFVLDAIVSSLVRGLVTASRLWKLGDPKSRVAIGNGVFNLARREVFEKTKGFPWIALEVLDDQVFGQMMKRAGARCGVFNPAGDVALYFYRSVGEMMRGLEKNGYVLMGQLRPHRFFVTATMFLYLELAPGVALAFSSTRIVGAVLLLMLAAVQMGLAHGTRRPIAPAFVPLFGPLLFVSFIARSMILMHVRGGVSWRGTFYSLADLRRGQRFELS